MTTIDKNDIVTYAVTLIAVIAGSVLANKYRDTTSLRMRERGERARDSEHERKRLAIALEATGLGLWEYDIATDVVIWDARTRAMFGVGPGTPIDFAVYMSLLHPGDAAGLNAVYSAAVGGANGGKYSVLHRTADPGDERWVHGSGQVIFEKDGRPVRVLGTVLDVTEEMGAQERQDLLMAELNHRVKNNLAIVQSMALQTAKRSTDLATFLSTFEGRLVALARTHDVLTRNAWAGAELGLLMAGEMAPFGERVRVSGPELTLSANQALAVGLIVHELAINAAKYGALSTDAGEVAMNWRRAGDSVELAWAERGGPTPEAPSQQGFGGRLIDSLTRRDLRGQTSTHYGPPGLDFTLIFPLDEAGRSPNGHSISPLQRRPSGHPQTSTSGASCP
jgi:two-component sensor histidine kinase